ncbi:hypothetical protein GCM10027589_00170 [Actinocorallia lasiicapitis]
MGEETRAEGLERQVERLIPVAQVAMLNMVRMMAAAGIPREELAFQIPAGWPTNLKRAFTEALPRLKDIARVLALAEGGEGWDGLPVERKAVHFAAAFVRVMESPMAEVPHASGVETEGSL